MEETEQTTPVVPVVPPAAQSDFSAEITRLRAEIAEKDQAVRYWHGQAKAIPTAQPTPVTPEEDDTDVLDLITTKGAKGLDELLAKRGYMRADEVERTVNQKATAIARENKLLSDYPDLKDTDSDFFKATAKEYASLKGSVPDHVAMEMAAERAELKALKAGKAKAADADERSSRARAQAGDTGTRRRPAAEPDDDDDTLTDEQKRVADSFGISHEAYAKRAKAGVNMSARNAPSMGGRTK